MGFMQLQSSHFVAYRVETTAGIYTVPTEFMLDVHSVGECGHRDDSERDNDTLDILEQYCEGRSVSFEVVEGWWARYSANGFLDATDFCGPFDTEQEAIKACKELYGDEDE